MRVFEAILLGVIQGLTEFLPVSSSGHLVLAQTLLGVNNPGVLLEVVLHLGTLVSVIIVFWQDVAGLIQATVSLISNPRGRRIPAELRTYRRLVGLLLLGIIPTALIGIPLEPVFSRLFDSQFTVGIALLATGAVLYFISRRKFGQRGWRHMNWWDAMVVGLAQGLAITPGLSRSGMTISAALSRGLTRQTATRFSFLISLPTIGGAAVLQLRHLFDAAELQLEIGPLVVGFLAAATSGILAIKLLVGVLQKGKLQYFAYYVWVIGVLTMVGVLTGVVS
ncbi:MAG: undecaprenyl-diphosphate phosphatase [Bacillota bacterium]|jgi:undecaprenyl-diphosphatase